jgi:hypothetical protein
MIPRCPECLSEDVRGGEKPGEAMACGNCPAVFGRNDAMVQVGDVQSVIAIHVDGRDDGDYLFADAGDADRFAAAVMAGGGSCSTSDAPVNAGRDAERLIAAERGDAMEDIDSRVAEEVREGKPLADVIGLLASYGTYDGPAVALLGTWKGQDEGY